MALRNPPSWLQNGSHPAENDRLTTQALFYTTGVIGLTAVSNSLRVTQNSPTGMSVLVGIGRAAIVGTTQSDMGTYVAFNDASAVATITTANPSNPRIDRICLTVSDAYYTGSLNQVAINVVAGTPASSPVAPATPANSISLATVAVAAGTTAIVNANITDTRTETTTLLPILPTTPRIGQVVTATTTNITTTTSAGVVDVSGLAVTITPTSATSKIFITTSFNTTAGTGGTQFFTGIYSLLRGSTSLTTAFTGGYYPSGGGINTVAYDVANVSYVDSPATTSATTYKMQINNLWGNTYSANSGGYSVQITAMEILV